MMFLLLLPIFSTLLGSSPHLIMADGGIIYEDMKNKISNNNISTLASEAAKSCPLLCKNEATCHRERSINLLHLIQLSNTVDSCGPCPPNYVGIACDVPSTSDKDCDYAFDISDFAGYMCEDPVTEYCKKDGSEYCTNGGKCTKYYNTTITSNDGIPNWNFTTEQVCVCPPEFNGPHCEWLKAAAAVGEVTMTKSSPSPIQNQNNQNGDARMKFSTFVLVPLLVIVIGILFLFHQRRERFLNPALVATANNDGVEGEGIWNMVESTTITSSHEVENITFT